MHIIASTSGHFLVCSTEQLRLLVQQDWMGPDGFGLCPHHFIVQICVVYVAYV